MYDTQKPRVLIVEDEIMVSMLIEDMVCDLGGQVVGRAAKFEQAMILALEEDFDLAVLDVNVDGLVIYPVADVLRYRGIPFVFVTGYDSSVVPHRYKRYCVLSKPFSHQTFSDAVEEVLADGPAVHSPLEFADGSGIGREKWNPSLSFVRCPSS